MSDASESRVQSEIRLRASALGWILWRNNTGMGWAGKSIRLPNGDVLVKQARPLWAGLIKGSSDLIGLRPLLILPGHVGTTIAQFVAVECKSAAGAPTTEQANFLRVVKESGGLDIVARSAKDLR